MAVSSFAWSAASKRVYDIAIYAVGFESRARHVASLREVTAKRTVCVDFESAGVFAYDENKRFYESVGARFVSCRSTNFIATLTLEFTAAKAIADTERRSVQIFLDCSSLTRQIVAQVLLLAAGLLGQNVEVCVAYALSNYEPPPPEAPSYISEPVVPALAGWSSDLDKPPYVVMGLGYEVGRALGCLDYLEASTAALLLPKGLDPRFLEDVRKSNQLLISLTDTDAHILYDVLDPFETYQKLDSLTFGAMRSHRVVLVPLGPKILASLCVMLAIENYPNVCVWRVSGGGYEVPMERSAAGEVTSVSFVPSDLRHAVGQAAFADS